MKKKKLKAKLAKTRKKLARIRARLKMLSSPPAEDGEEAAPASEAGRAEVVNEKNGRG